jgi:biotin synthase
MILQENWIQDVARGVPAYNWQRAQLQQLFDLSFNDLLFLAQTVHRVHFSPNEVQASRLLSIKTGACPEDCRYCSQSGHYDTGLEKEKRLAVEKVLEAAKEAQAEGATRFCMGAAWRSPSERDMPYVLEMVKAVKEMGLETCMTLGMLKPEQAHSLAEAGLDYYNHNLDTSKDYYPQIITTRTYQDRLDTLGAVREAGIKVCTGGILGMGESHQDRLALIAQLANISPHPESVPMNLLVKIPGTPLADTPDLDPFEFVRMIAIARIIMPKTYIRLSAGRESLSDQTQAWCFFAGANSIFHGDKLLTTDNPDSNRDAALFARLGLKLMPIERHMAMPAKTLIQAPVLETA